MSTKIINNKINLTPSCLYGKSEIDSKIHNIRDILGNNILDYRITKIKCQIKSNEGIYGIEMVYKNLITEEEKTLINIKSEEPNLIEQEIKFDLEIILASKVYHLRSFIVKPISTSSSVNTSLNPQYSG